MDEFYGRILHSRPHLSAEQERAALDELGELSRSGTKEALKRAKDRFIEANLKLVVRIARPYLASPLHEEIIQEGNMGLMRALETFDSSRGCRFNTYASWWIRAYIKRFMHENGRLVRVPEGMEKLIAQVRRLESVSVASTGFMPSIDAVASALKLSHQQADFLIELSESLRAHLSLDAAVFEGERTGKTMGDLIQGGDLNDDVERMHALRRARLRAARALECLSARERRVIEERFELDGNDAETLENIGRTMGVTRERVRQIQAEATVKMRRALEQQAD